MRRQKDVKYSNWTGMQLSLFHPPEPQGQWGGPWNNTIKIYLEYLKEKA
jgi:hypothetical protein